MTSTRHSWLGVVLVSIACSGGEPAPTTPTPNPAPTANTVRLVSIEPAEGTPLQRGQPVTFTGTVAYTVAIDPDPARPANVILTIQEDTPEGQICPPTCGRLLQQLPQPSVLVGRGNGQVTLSGSIQWTGPDVRGPVSTTVRVRLGFVLGGTGMPLPNVILSYPVQRVATQLWWAERRPPTGRCVSKLQIGAAGLHFYQDEWLHGGPKWQYHTARHSPD